MSAVAVPGALGGVGRSAELTLSVPALSAADRLERSRDRLRAAMTPTPQPARRQRDPDSGEGLLTGWAEALWERLRAVPVAAAVAEALGAWWANHPLRGSAMVAQNAARGVAGPLAQRHPLALVAGALVFGAVLSRLRPWRWLPRTLLFAGLLPQVAAKLVASVPAHSWLNALSSVAAAPSAKGRSAAPRRRP